MHRSLLPSILASLGYVIVLLATSIPLFEWKISETVTDFPPTYDVHISSYPLTTILGESLGPDSYLGKVYVSKDGAICRYGDTNFIVRRSQNDEALQQVSLNVNKKYIPWLDEWSVMEVYLAGIYIWWFTIWYKRPIWEAVVMAVLFTGVAVFIFILLTQIVRPFLWRVGASPEYFGTLDCYSGMITLKATLSKVHYETLIVLFAGILLELGALGMMLRQIVKAAIERKQARN